MTVHQHDWTTAAELPLEEETVDLVISDPPYNIGVPYADDDTNDGLPLGEYFEWLIAPSMRASLAMLRPGGIAAWICPAKHGGAIWTLIAQGEFERRECLWGAPIVWRESFAQYQQRRMTEDYRFIFLIRKPGGELTFNPDDIRIQSKRQEMGDKRADPRGRVPGMVWEVRRLQGTSSDRVDWHPAQLAPELIQRLVLGFSNPGELVVDPFAGSGNVGVCCKRTGRRFVGFDKSATYVEKANDRIGGN